MNFCQNLSPQNVFFTLIKMPHFQKHYDSSFVVRTRPIPATKNIKPSAPYIIGALIPSNPFVEVANIMAANI
jgi:hypothetical protein